MAVFFENLVEEVVKARNRGLGANFFRDGHGNEIDLLHKSGRRLLGLEIKAAATWHAGFKTGLMRFSEKCHPLDEKYVVYRGRPFGFEDGVEAISFERVGSLFEQRA